MKKDLAYYENGIKEGSIIDLEGLKPGDKVYLVNDVCNGRDCPYNGGYGQSRCNSSGNEYCKSYIEEVKFEYNYIPYLDTWIFKDYDKAVQRRDVLNSKTK